MAVSRLYSNIFPLAPVRASLASSSSPLFSLLTSFIFSVVWSRRQKNHDRKKHTMVMNLHVTKTPTTTCASPSWSYSKQWPFLPHLWLKTVPQQPAFLQVVTQKERVAFWLWKLLPWLKFGISINRPFARSGVQNHTCCAVGLPKPRQV